MKDLEFKIKNVISLCKAQYLPKHKAQNQQYNFKAK